MLNIIFENILFMSAAGSILSIFWLCLKPVTKKLFSPKWQYYIWLSILITMILPVRFSIPSRTAAVQPPVQTVNSVTHTEFTENQTQIHIPQTLQKTSEISKIPKITLSHNTNTTRHLSVIWLLGAAAVLFIKSAKYMVFTRKINKNSYEDNNIVNIPKRLHVRRTQLLDAPLIIGIIKPVLYLPDIELSPKNLNYILMHELTHYRRHDILYKWFTMLVKSVHWFNPFIYIVSEQIDLDCEISCDIAVTDRLSEQEKNNYMNMILDMILNSRCSSHPLATQMASNKNILKRRFEMIRNKKKTNIFVSVLSAITAAVIFSGTVFASGIFANNILNGNMSDWAKDNIKKAEEYVLIYDEMGITDYTQNITREMFCQFAANVFIHSGITLRAWEYPFTDIPVSDTYISCLYCMGIINGKTETEFAPNDYMTREEAAVILYRMYRYSGLINYPTVEYVFSDDADISDFAKDSIYNLQFMHILDGVGNDMFNPKGNITIEQTLSAMLKLCETFDKTDLYTIDKGNVLSTSYSFFNDFNESNFDFMKSYCTEKCINTFFGDGYCFGMKQANIKDIEITDGELTDFIVRVTVDMIPHELSAFAPNQSETSFYLIMKKQSDGKYLIDGFSN